MATSDESETVWIAQNWQKHDTYHTDSECQHLHKGKNVQPRNLADVVDRREECAYCAGDGPDTSEGDWSFYRDAVNADP